MTRHLAAGLRILGDRWWSGVRRWLGAGENWLDTAVRWLLVGGGLYGAAHLLLGSLLGVGVVALAVCVKALRAATKAVRGEQPDTAEPPAAEPGDDLPPGEFMTFVWAVLDGAPAVHLATLARRLAEHTGQPWDGDRVRAACREAGVPIRPKVRDLGGDRVSSGVHRDDLEPLPQPLPEVAQKGPVDTYVAGQDGNATPLPDPHPTALQPVTRRLGDLRITSTPDTDNPHRTHVTVLDPTRRKGA